MDTERIIRIRGAKEHNLKSIDLDITHNQITVITGPSGSGKSTLAFDTIYAEGQRRYVESLSTYARQFLDNLQKPDVESISGLSPSISIDQSSMSTNPRSTVGTLTEIYDFMRLFWSKISYPICNNCGKPVNQTSVEQIVDSILAIKEGTKLIIYSPFVRGRKGEYRKEIEDFRRKGFQRIRIDGELLEIGTEINIDKKVKHNIDLVIDRVVVSHDQRFRIREAVEKAIHFSEGLVIVSFHGKEKEDILFNQKYACVDCGIGFSEPEPRIFSFNSPMGACPTCNGLGKEVETGVICNSCEGAKLKKESLAFLIEKKNIAEVSKLLIVDTVVFFENLKLNDLQKNIGEKIRLEIISRLNFLNSVGLGYLSIDRGVNTLSGGELQRARLATQLGASLVGVTYILDEPSIGLHPSDHHKLIDNIKELKRRGNTVLIVEHDRDTMENSDFIVDIGPGAGVHGGHIVAKGNLNEIKAHEDSLTGLYLSGKKKIISRAKKKFNEKDKYIELKGANGNNLKKLNLKIPIGKLVGVTGVSGSGKSSLILDTLYPALLKERKIAESIEPLPYEKLTGISEIDKVLCIDQSPIGRTPRSNPVTYVNIFNEIRTVFAELPESKIRGYKPGRFSFNVAGANGRCEKCSGDGYLKLEMQFMPDVFVLCEECNGKRYNPETLQVRFKGKSISDILNMSVEEALTFFNSHNKITRVLNVLNDVGLGYIKLGQPANTLSGGEAQRIKLASELGKRNSANTVFILDEPTTGLHFDDVNKLLIVLDKLVEQGSTVILIEHNMDIIREVDYLIDLGPSGGNGGGEIVFEGPIDEIRKNKKSLTAKFI